jgi:hypothetical protein
MSQGEEPVPLDTSPPQCLSFPSGAIAEDVRSLAAAGRGPPICRRSHACHVVARDRDSSCGAAKCAANRSMPAATLLASLLLTESLR